jgi:hypothetical protein
MTIERFAIVIERGDGTVEVMPEVWKEHSWEARQSALGYWERYKGVAVKIVPVTIDMARAVEVVQEGKRNIPGGPTNLEIDAHGKPLNM